MVAVDPVAIDPLTNIAESQKKWYYNSQHTSPCWNVGISRLRLNGKIETLVIALLVVPLDVLIIKTYNFILKWMYH